MPALTIQIPTALVADLTTIANQLFAARGIDGSAFTQTQAGQRFIAELLKDQIVNFRLSAAVAAAATTELAARATAQATADAAQTAAVTAAAGITG